MDKIRDKFLSELNNYQYHYIEDGNNIIIINPDTHVDDYHIDLSLIKELPDNVTFNNKGNVWMNALTKIGENVEFNNGGFVGLGSLKHLNNNVHFNNSGFVNLDKLEEIPKGFIFNNNRGVYLLSVDIKNFNDCIFVKNQQVGFNDIDTREWECNISNISNGRIINIIARRL